MYIDPGSTNFIIQIVIGALAGAGLAIATFWRRIRLFFSKRKDGDAATSTAAPAAASDTPPVAPPAQPAATIEPPAATEPGSASTPQTHTE